MRPLDESKTRWDETLKQSSSFADLQRAVKFNGPGSPCVSGCRSVCWKAFLLFQDVNLANWSHVLLENRNSYSSLREHHLKYIKHPELLNELSLDPLADDPDSPWTAVRHDEAIRAEILQDVQRLPDEPFYHQESTQTLILDILFIWVKLNSDQGGYRQGMHELLAPLLYVVDGDAIDRKNIGDAIADPNMVEMLDSYFIEHDTFALFSNLMKHTKPFYEVSVDAGSSVSGEQSAIVEKSRMIHEVALMRIDPELAKHLQNIEILPQIFLIRWIRLLFGREFPFEQLLVLWDTIFAFDPTLDLIDLICVAVLLRIRWTLLEADYTVALQLLLKYPAPEPPHGPHTFVDDALYLQDHYNAAGGSSIIMKYTGKTPSPISEQSPSTPEAQFQGLSLRDRTRSTRSPLRSPARFIQQRGVEALFQGAAKNVIERGEKLGINQAVRDAMGEIRKNMQDFQEARSKTADHSRSRSNTPRHNNLANGTLISPVDDLRKTIAELEQRNTQLALLLDEAITGLKEVSASKLESDREKTLEGVELAAAKAQLVKVYLENPSLELPQDEPREDDRAPPQIVVDDHLPVPAVAEDLSPATANINNEASPSLMVAADEMMVDPEVPGTPKTEATMEGVEHSSPLSPTQPAPPPALLRPTAVPTRSTMAQSSFALMLEPDQSPSAASSSYSPSSLPSSATATQHPHSSRKSPRVSVSRDRNAFLFGEVTDQSGAAAATKAFTSDDIFGLEPLRRPSKARGKYEDLFGGALSEG
ncbi:hypothetical protein N8I77_008005 [Diaporthe amygdali]|uniref:Rab-GAP TBC domain-containing protein n=1 Tax=Phomopsis amygdali TaxID=1214568 RepID=A0AAD9SCT9_PHOAM|nr:hypothetical protein N8I77_008005 [Diaporthe amygdali]